MADAPLIPPLEMERPIRTDVPLEEDEVLADFADTIDLQEPEIEEDISINIEEPDEDGSVVVDFSGATIMTQNEGSDFL